MKISYLIIVIIFIGCQSQIRSDSEVIDEAKSFFESYAEDLKSKDVENIISRYHQSGVFFLGNGQKRFQPYDAVKKSYQENWNGPDGFEWKDLSFEVISSDAVMVLGTFHWKNKSSAELLIFSYSGLLIREDGQFRIKMEDESVDPLSMKHIICPPDSITSD